MVREDESTVGTLTISVTHVLPQKPEDSDSTYQALNYQWAARQLAVLSVRCTQIQAAKVTSLFRERNKDLIHKSVWVGPQEL